MTNLSLDDCTVTVKCQEEIQSPEDYFCGDESYIEPVQENLTGDNPWGWCQVSVTVSWENLEATEGIGLCSYKDKQDFVKSARYWELCKAALYKLNKAYRNQLEDQSVKVSIPIPITIHLDKDRYHCSPSCPQFVPNEDRVACSLNTLISKGARVWLCLDVSTNKYLRCDYCKRKEALSIDLQK
jgi:hypothetical protein